MELLSCGPCVVYRVTTGGEENVVINPMKIFHGAIENVKPAVSTESVRRGGRSYHVRNVMLLWISLD